MNKIVIWTFSQVELQKSNVGDKAIFTSLLTALKELIPDVKIVTFSDDPNYTLKHYGVNAVQLWKIKTLSETLKVLYDADLVILGGGVLQDRSCLLYLPFHLGICFLAMMLGKPVVCYAIGIVSCDEISRLGKFLIKLAFNRMNLITVRDEESKKVLRDLGVINPRIYVTADPAFALTPAPLERTREILAQLGIIKGNRPLIGIAPRRMYHGNFSILPVCTRIKFNLMPPEFYTQNQKLGKILAQVADYLVTTLDADIVFIPMYTGPKFSYRDDDFALEIIRMMEHQNRAKMIVTDDYTPQELQGIFGQMDLVIGIPLHSLILAITMGVPAIGIKYSTKIEHCMKMVGQEIPLIGIKEINLEDLLTKIEETLLTRELIKLRLKNKVELLKNKALLNAELISKLFR
jgi:polysaccharide pyruvyl transferase CsaB